MAEDSNKGAPSRQSASQQADATAKVISTFGGLRPMGKKLGVAVSTLQGWQARGQIPEGRAEEIAAAAERESLRLDPAVLAAATGQAPGAGGGDAAVQTTRADPLETPSGKFAETAEQAKPHTAGDPQAKASQPSEDHSEEEKLSGELEEGEDAPAHERAEVAEVRTTGGAEGASESVSGPAASPEPERPQPPSLPAESRSGGGVAGPMLIGALLLALGLAIAVVARGVWLPVFGVPEDVETQQAVAALQQQVSGLEQQLAEQAAVAPPPPGLGESEVQGLIERRAAELSGQIDGLSEQLRSVESAASSGPDAAALEGLEGQVAELSGRLSDLSSRLDSLTARVTEASGGGEAALVLALTQLRDALRLAAPYEEALAGVEERLGESAGQVSGALGTLKSHAANGLPTRRLLAERFPAVAREIASAGYAAEEAWYGGILNRVNEVVSIRPIGADVAGQDPDAIAARAEAKVEAGDLSGAVAELEGLSGAAAEAAAGWLADAKARLAAEAALAEVTAAAAEHLAPGGRSSGQ